MNNDDFSAPRGPQDLTELPEEMIRAKIQRQCARWRFFTLDDEWYELVKWWVTVKKDKIPTWRVRWYWRDEYLLPGRVLDYKAWFRAVVSGDQILAIDGQPLDISHAEAIKILQSAGGLVEVIVARGPVPTSPTSPTTPSVPGSPGQTDTEHTDTSAGAESQQAIAALEQTDMVRLLLVF